MHPRNMTREELLRQEPDSDLCASLLENLKINYIDSKHIENLENEIDYFKDFRGRAMLVMGDLAKLIHSGDKNSLDEAFELLENFDFDH